MTTTWDTAWPRFSTAEYLVVGLLVALLMAFTEITPRMRARWDRPVLFDDGIRARIRADTSGQRRRAGRASDLLLWASTIAPFACCLVLSRRHNGDVATQLALMSTLALLAASGANRIATTLAGRPRPYTRVLDREGQIKRHPSGHPERLRSFFSGHTALTATGSSLVATFAMHLNWVDGALMLGVLITAIAATVAVATLRVRADRHYFSDVAAGAVVGVMCGAGYPIWAHFSAA